MAIDPTDVRKKMESGSEEGLWISMESVSGRIYKIPAIREHLVTSLGGVEDRSIYGYVDGDIEEIQVVRVFDSNGNQLAVCTFNDSIPEVPLKIIKENSSNFYFTCDEQLKYDRMKNISLLRMWKSLDGGLTWTAGPHTLAPLFSHEELKTSVNPWIAVGFRVDGKFIRAKFPWSGWSKLAIHSDGRTEVLSQDPLPPGNSSEIYWSRP
ncbi:MAG TPA: hypothetical protein VFF76_06620 [Holophagaceae bacterium]|nr:hypothetical protein [Holophagaceae bacterium]